MESGKEASLKSDRFANVIATAGSSLLALSAAWGETQPLTVILSCLRPTTATATTL